MRASVGLRTSCGTRQPLSMACFLHCFVLWESAGLDEDSHQSVCSNGLDTELFLMSDIQFMTIVCHQKTFEHCNEIRENKFHKYLSH
ncbi:hypothetical protein Bpfe_023233 [Biomphalaria pfeifferi]|uniref:Uncharacterized protein n=1 Tax=Biomphalaria pfeifferi TaxID=112525 RepID=A0AAD8B3H8_BIOPF|nr:hypothetical protein Bpfe_023233 [Biomphalaria pfeifferi]